MKKPISSIVIIVLAGTIIVTAIKAADTATITATVTVQNISVSVSPGSIDYGTIGLNSSKSTCDIGSSISVVNNGNVTENFQIKGSNSENWTLGTSPGNETYVHKFSSSTCPWTSGTPLSTSYATLANGVPRNATTTLNLQITTPTATGYFDPQSVNVTIQASI